MQMGITASRFICNLPKTGNGYASITKCVDRFTGRGKFIKRKVTNTAVETIDLFFGHSLERQVLPDNIESECDSKVYWCLLRK